MRPLGPKRILSRLLLAAGLAVVAALVSLYVTLTSARFEDRMKNGLLKAAADAVGADVHIDKLELEPLKLEAVLLGVSADPPGGGHVRARRIDLRIDPWSVLGEGPRFAALRLEDASIDIDLGLLPLGAFAGGGGKRMPLPERIELASTELKLHAGDLTAVLAGTNGDLVLGDRELSASLRFDLTALRLDGRELAPGRLRLEARLVPGERLVLEQLRGTLRTGPLDVRGTVDLEALAFDLKARATVETAALAALLNEPGLASGSVLVVGPIVGPVRSPRFAGTLTADEVIVKGLPFRQIRGDLAIGRRGLALTNATARFLEGDVAFLGRLPFPPRATDITFQAKDGDIALVPAIVRGFPFIAGTASAEGTLHAGRPEGLLIDAQARFKDVDSSLNASLTDPRLNVVLSPATGTAHLRVEHGTIEVVSAEATNAWGAGHVTGHVKPGGPIDLDVALASVELEPVARLELDAPPWDTRSLPYRVLGHATGQVHVGGTTASPELHATLGAPSVVLEGPADDPAPGVALSAASGTLDYAERRFRWQASATGPPHIEVTGETRIPEGGATEHTMDLTSEGWDAARLLRLARAPLDATGRADLRARLAVTGAGVSGDLTGSLRGALAGTEVEVREAGVRLEPGHARLTSLDAALAGGHVRVSGDLPVATGQAGLDFTVDGLALATLAGRAQPDLIGTLSASGRVSGTAGSPVVEARTSARGVTALGTLVGDLDGTVRTENGVATLSMQRADLDLDVTADLQGARAFEAKATFREASLAPLAALLPVGAPADAADQAPLVNGSFSGTLAASGTLSPPALSSGRVSVSTARATVGTLELSTQSPFEARLVSNDKVELLGLKLEGPQTELRVEGSIGLSGTTSDVHVEGSTDLRILRAFAPDVTVSGPLELDLDVSGSTKAPHLDGRASLTEGYFRTPLLPYPLRDVKGEVRFTGTRAILPGVTARFGGGQIQADGTIDLADLAAPTLKLHATGEDVRLTLFGDLDVRANPDLTYEINETGPSIVGTLRITRATYTARGGLDATGFGRPHGLGTGGSESSLGSPETRLQLTVVADSNLWLISSEARIQADAALTITGTAGDPVVLGRVSYLSQERLELQGRRYRIARGSLVFDNPSEIDPRLDALVETELQGIDVTLQITGPLSGPQVTARSDPPLPQSDVFSLLIGGTPRERGETGVAGPSGDEVLRSLFLPRAISRLTGGYFTVDVGALRGKADPTEVLPIALRPAEKIDVTLGVPLREARTGLVILNWRPFTNWSFSATRDLDRAVGLEAGWERRFGSTGSTHLVEPRVLSVRLVGAPEDIVARLTERLKTEVGDRLSPDRLRGDVDRLTETLRDLGYPLARVSARVEQEGEVVERASGKDTAKAGDTVLVGPAPDGAATAPGIAPDAATAGTAAAAAAAAATVSPSGAPEAAPQAHTKKPGGGGAGARVVFEVGVGEPVAIALQGVAKGDHLKDDKLKERLAETVQSFGLYGETTGELERTTRAALEEKGYARSVVSCERETTEDVRIVCDIDPGVRYHIEEIDIEGNEHLSSDRCRSVLRTRKGIFHTARLVTAHVEDDVEALRALYAENGYLRAQARAEVQEGKDTDTLRLVFHVDEGILHRVQEIRLQGATTIEEKTLRDVMHLEPGDALMDAEVRRDRDAIFRVYDRHGYMDAKVKAEQHEHPPSGSGLADLDFRVTEGPIVHVRVVRIEGALRTKEGVIRKALGLRAGSLIGYGRVAAGQRALYDLGIFRSVDIASEPVPDDLTLRDVVVRLEEAAPYRLQMGGGLDSKQGVRGLFELADSNLTGRARYLGLQLRAAGDSARAQILFREPRPFGLDLPSFLTTFYERRHDVSFDQERTAFRAEATRPLARSSKTRALFRYALTDTNLYNLKVSTLEAGAENVRISSLGFAMLRDTRDDVLEPHRGLLASADVEWADHALGSQASFTKLTLKGYRFQRLGRKLVWASAAQVGLGFPRDPSGSSLPLAERYFSGGATSLRGFDYNEAGPRDPETNEPTGGNAVLVINEELRRDLFRRIVGSVFVDAGNVYAKVSELTSSELRWSAGVGLRYRGPIVAGIDYARLLDARPGEKAHQIHFSLGYAF